MSVNFNLYTNVQMDYKIFFLIHSRRLLQEYNLMYSSKILGPNTKGLTGFNSVNSCIQQGVTEF